MSPGRPRISQMATSTPSADVPDIKPMTIMARGNTGD